MLIKVPGTISCVKFPRIIISGVNAYLFRSLLNEPFSQNFDQFRCDAFPAVFRIYVDPLQFALAIQPPGEMTGNKSYHFAIVTSRINNTRRQSLLRIVLPVHIGSYSWYPITHIAPAQRTQPGKGWDVRL